jgi:hypothetical protein
MPARQGPDWLALRLTPIAGASACGVGAILHVNGEVSAGAVTLMIVMAAIVTVVAMIASIARALAPHLAALWRERSHARVRRAVIEHKLSADEAVALITGERQPAAVRGSPPAPAQRLRRPPGGRARGSPHRHKAARRSPEPDGGGPAGGAVRRAG